MGTYLNPGKAAYQMAINSEIFIDKTEMIQYINSVVNTQQRFVSVSRPRRFGKTMAADMICAYYDREAVSRELFEKRKLAQTAGWDEFLGKFDVIRLVMTDFFGIGRTVEDALNTIKSRVLLERARELLRGVEPGSRVTLRVQPEKLSQMLGQRRENVKTLREEFRLSELRVRPDAAGENELLVETAAPDKSGEIEDYH